MNNKTKNLLSFTAGAVIGSVVTWQVLKRMYNQIIQEEVKSIKEAFSKRYNAQAVEEEATEVEINEEEQKELLKQEKEKYIEKVANSGYNKGALEEEKYTFPRVISPDEYGEYPGYKMVSLTYFEGDGILADDYGKQLDIEETVSMEAIESMGEYEDDAIHVRNNEMKTDFEVLLDVRSYSEVYPNRS